MKRKLSIFLAIALLASIIIPALPAVTAADDVVTIYVSKGGADTNPGTETAPVRTINQAYKNLYTARSTGAGTVDNNIIMVMDELGEGGLAKWSSNPTYLCGDTSWANRVNATIRGASDEASINMTTGSGYGVVFSGSTVFDNINLHADHWSEYGTYVTFYRSLVVTDTVTTSGRPIVMNFARFDTNATATINGGSWGSIFVGISGAANTLNIGGNAEVTDLYAAGAAVRNSGTISCTNVTMNLTGGSVENLYLGGRTREKYSSNIHSNILTAVNLNMSAGSLTNLYLGGWQMAADSGAINVTTANVNQTGGVIENVYGGRTATGCTSGNTIGTLNATFLDTNAINFEISSMPTTAMNLNFEKATVNFDATDLAAIKNSGATETTLTLGKTAATTDGYEEAYSIAMSGINATADVTLTLDAHIKTANVLNNGTTAAMGADKKVAFTDAALGLFEIDIIEANAATIGTTGYPSFEDALNAAVSGDTINLMADVDMSGETIVLNPGVQVYLGEFDLTADRVIGLDGAAIGGYSMDAKLNVAQNMLKLDSTYINGDGYQIVPVWNGDHYTFTIIDFQKVSKTEEDGKLKFTFAHVAYTEVDELLAQANGATNCGLDVQLKLTWDIDGKEFSAICDYDDADIAVVAGSSTAMYTMTLPGFTALGMTLDNVTITPMVVSCTGAVAAM